MTKFHQELMKNLGQPTEEEKPKIPINWTSKRQERWRALSHPSHLRNGIGPVPPTRKGNSKFSILVIIYPTEFISHALTMLNLTKF